MADVFDFYVRDNRKINFEIAEPIMREDSGVTDFLFHIPKTINGLDMSDWSWWFVFVNAKKEKYSIALELSDDPESPLENNLATYTVNYAMSIKAGSVQFALEAINTGTGGAIDNEWHTLTYETKVKDTLQGNQAEYAETESDIISALLEEVRTKVNQLVGGATPAPVRYKAQMTDPNAVYLYIGSEPNEHAGHWYYHNGTTFVSGGVYGAGVTDPVPTQGSANAVSSGGVYSVTSAMQADIDAITENHSEESTISIPVDESDVRNKRAGGNVGSAVAFTNSSVTKCIVKAFAVEANKTYVITINNGQPTAGSGTGTRDLIVSDDGIVVWLDAYQASTGLVDTIEITPTASGWFNFNVDANYVSVEVTTDGTTTTITAKDTVARAGVAENAQDISELSETVAELSGIGSTVETISETITELSETYEGENVDVNIPVDESDVRAKFAGGNVGGSVNFNNSTKTKCIVEAFEVEANKEYTITINNGQPTAGSGTGTRDLIVVADGKIAVKEAYYPSTGLVDIVKFTPTTSGWMYLNVDANYVSVEVTTSEPQQIKTFIDKKSRDEIGFVEKYVFGKEVDATTTFESGSFTKALGDATGEGYRSGVITGVSNCVVCLKVNPTYSFMFGDGANDLLTGHGLYTFHTKTDKMRVWISDTVANSGFEMRIYKKRGHVGKYDVVVAAYDSEEEDKALADIVCDGSNDEIDLQFAINWKLGKSTYHDRCNVLLLPGTYNLDNFVQQETVDGTQTNSKYAVMIGGKKLNGYAGYVYRVSVEGCYETEHREGGSATKIVVTENAISTLSDSIDNVALGLARIGEGTGSIYMNSFTCNFRNLCISCGGYLNKIIAIDAYPAGNVVIKNCDIWSSKGSSSLTSEQISNIPQGSIGIRAGRGSCLGVRQRIEGNRIRGFYEGIALCGEHFIVQDNLEVRCVYGFTLNNYPVGGAVQHPNIFIGNSIEQCLKMAKIAESGTNTTLIYIGGSVENKNSADNPAVAMLPIEISANTAVRGRIESDSLASPYNNSFFYEGYGQTFEQTIYPYYQA